LNGPFVPYISQGTVLLDMGFSLVQKINERNDSINNAGSQARVDFGSANHQRARGKEPNMLIIGCDYHPSFQQIAFVDTETGELGEQRLIHPKEAEQFYGELKERNIAVRVGIEASGHARWFERLLRQLQFELWIGDAAEIRTKRVRKQKTDRQDAQLLLRLIMKDRFPRIWVADAENRDLRQLLWHRQRLVQMRTRVMNQLHVVALNEGLRRRKGLWRPGGRKELELIALAPWAGRRRQDLLDLFDQLTPKIQELTRALEQEVEKRPVTRRLMTHPGVGPLTALAYELVIGTPERFHNGKQIASYVGLVPEEKSSGDRRRLGHISKQGNALLRFLLVEAAQVTIRSQAQWRSKFFHLAMRRGRKIAKVAMARKLAVHLYWMWRQGWDYASSNVSVRTRESPDIPMANSKSPT
jgi:transposase